VEDKKFKSPYIRRASRIGLQIGAGSFLAFPLPKTGVLTDIVKGIAVVPLLVFVASSMYKKKEAQARDGSGAKRALLVRMALASFSYPSILRSQNRIKYRGILYNRGAIVDRLLVSDSFVVD
jgi:hypothetical protein